MNYLLRLFDEHQPRRIRVIENTLRNRRTVSTLFWAEQYGMLNWTGANRSLSREKFDHLIKGLLAQKLITIDHENRAKLTTAGVLRQEEWTEECYHPVFFDWYWLANTQKIEQRFLLGVQVVSELAYHNRYYAPVSNDYLDQQMVKRWLQCWRGNVVNQLAKELTLLGRSLANEDQRLANYFCYSLIGHQITGWTTQQAADALELSPSELDVVKQDALLAVAAFADGYHGLLTQLLRDLLAVSPLSDSANRSLQLYQRGFTIEQIAQQRRIKVNTVREHLLEAAIVYPTGLNWDTLLPAAIRQDLHNRYHGDVGQWQFEPNNVPGGKTAFFYFRLYQIFKSRQEKNDQ